MWLTEDQTNDHEGDNCPKFQDTGPELFFSETKDTCDVDDNDGDQEDCNPDCNIYILIPISNSKTSDDKLEREDDSPLEDVVYGLLEEIERIIVQERITPSHSKTPRGIDEACRVSVETTRNRIHNGEFTESIDDVEDHDTHDGEINE